MGILWLLVVFAILFGVLFAIIQSIKSKKGKRTPITARQVITTHEQPLYLKLQEALPDYYVLAQVAFTAFLTAKGYATRNTFNRKVADFVILDKSFKAVAIIELDDSSHRFKSNDDAYRIS